jgi:hypothetical protein
MVEVGPKLEGEHTDWLLENCPFCGAEMIRFDTCPQTSFHPHGRECILEGFGVPQDKRVQWNLRRPDTHRR